jgi:hypothetical protein
MWIVTLAWVGNLIVGYLAPALGQQAVNAAFMLVLAILLRSVRRNRADNNDDETPAGALDEVRQIVGDAITGNPGRTPERREGDQP